MSRDGTTKDGAHLRPERGDDVTALPHATYFSLLGSLETGKGGTTAVLLMRHRLLEPLLRERGQHLTILTFAPRPCAEHWAELERQGALLPGSDVRNLYRDLATAADLDDGRVRTREPAEGTSDGRRLDLDDGLVLVPWSGAAGRRGRDVVRADGSLLARLEVVDGQETAALYTRSGRLVERWDSMPSFVAWWARRQLPADGTTVLLSDGHAVGAALVPLADRPDVVLVQQLHNPHQGKAYAPLRAVASSFDRLVVLTERQRDDLVAADPACERNVRVVPNPVVLPATSAAAPPRDRHRIVMLARIHPQKGLDRAVAAFHALAEEVGETCPGLRLDVYGKPDSPGLLETLRAQAGDDPRIVFHGYRQDARDALASADVMWLTSRFEGYPLAILEAYAAGAIVVANDCRYGPAELVDDGVTGFLVSVDDADVSALVAATRRAFALDQESAAEMRAAALDVAGAGSHSPAEYLEAWCALVADAVDESARGRAPARPSGRGDGLAQRLRRRLRGR